MNPMLKVSAAVLFAAMSALPVLAAVSPAAIVIGTKTDIVPVAKLDAMIGKWGKPELDALGSAKSVTLFDTHKLYSTDDIKLIGNADTTAWVNLVKMRTDLDANASLKAWFEKSKIDTTHVIAISDTGGKVEVYTY
ncbi:MAG: hypothetical protein ABIQ30_12275 [Devosia sp.]